MARLRLRARMWSPRIVGRRASEPRRATRPTCRAASTRTHPTHPVLSLWLRRLAKSASTMVSFSVSGVSPIRCVYVSMHWVFVAVLMLELLGALVNYSWWDGMTSEGSLGILILYLSSP